MVMPRYMGAVFRSPRTARLERDYRDMVALRNDSTILDFETRGDPPEEYQITFHGKTLVKNGAVRIADVQKLALRLGAQYPLLRPDVRWITPIHHPNIFTGTVCLGRFSQEWTPVVKLADFVEILWDMARLSILNPHSAGPGAAKEDKYWADLDRQFGFPVDKRPLRDKVLRRDEGSSILRPEGAQDDIVIIDDAPGVCGLSGLEDGTPHSSYAWETTPEDVQNVLRAHGIPVAYDEAERISYDLDDEAIAKAALWYTEMDDQADSVYDEIEDQLKELGMIPEGSPKRWSAP